MTGLVSMLKHMVMGCVVIALDLMVFWAFDVLHYHAQQEIVVRGKTLWVVLFSQKTLDAGRPGEFDLHTGDYLKRKVRIWFRFQRNKFT